MTNIEEKFSERRRFGNLGEELCEMFLVKRGFRVLERNYLKKWGEIDIIARIGSMLHFIEVKSKDISRERGGDNVSRHISRNSFTASDFSLRLSHETLNSDSYDYRPEDNLHYQKQKRILRAIQTYLIERKVDEDQEWQIDLITVSIDFYKKEAIINHIENVVFDV